MTTIKKNYLYNVIYQILTMILPLVTAPYISRVIGADGTGIYSYTYSIASYFILFAMLGLNNYGNRKIAQVRDNKEKLSKEFISIYRVQMIMSIIVISCYYIYIVFLCKQNKVIAMIQAIYVISALFDINWLFFGLEKFKIIVTRNIIIKVISTIFIFVIVKDKGDLWKYTVIMSSSILISQIIMWTFLKRNINIKAKVPLKNSKEHIKPLLILFIPAIATSLYRMMDKIMLGMLSNMNNVGQYEYADKIVSIPITFITAIGTVLLPKISNLISNKDNKKSKEYLDKSMEFTIFISIPLSLGIISVADNFIPIFLGNEYKTAGYALQLLSITIIPIAIGNSIKTQYLIPREKDREFVISTCIGAIINFIINSLLIPKFNVFGAVIGTILAELIVAFYQVYSVRDEIDYKLYTKIFFKYFTRGLIMLIVTNSLRFLKINELELVIIQIIIGICVYFILNKSYIFKLLKQK